MARANKKAVARSNRIGGWTTTGQIMHDASRQFQKLQSAKTRLDVDRIRTAATLLGLGVALVGLQLQYQRQTGLPKKQHMAISSFPIK